MQRITADYLRGLGACEEQVEIVEREWPNGAPITVPTIRKANWLGLDVMWLARRVLPAKAWTEYMRVRAEAWDEYGRVTASALAPLLRAALSTIKGDA